MCKRDLSSDFSSSDQPIIAYSTEYVTLINFNYHLLFLSEPLYYPIFSVLFAKPRPLYLGRFGSYIIDIPFASYICQQSLYFILVFVRTILWNSNSNLLKQIIHFIYVHHCFLRIIILK